MKAIYWNVSRVGNFDTKLAIKNLCDRQKSDFFFIDEPMIPYAHFLAEYLK